MTIGSLKVPSVSLSHSTSADATGNFHDVLIGNGGADLMRGFGGRDNGIHAHDQYTQLKTIWLDLADDEDEAVA